MYPKNTERGERALKVSQNYLTSSRTIQRLLDRTSLCSADHVLEIGPGKGHITRALLGRCERVTAVEIDPRLHAGLREKFASCPGLTLRHGDFMKYRLPRYAQYKVFSNIPFNRTTGILRKLTGAANPPGEIWLVVEKGAALRFCGLPRETLRSRELSRRYDARIIYYFRREDFHPMPSVDAVLLHLKRRDGHRTRM